MASSWTAVRAQLRRKRAWALIAFVVYTLFGFFVAPRIVRSQAIDAIAEQLGRTATIETVRVNPLIFSLAVRGFALEDPDGTPFVVFDEFYADFQVSSLFRWAWTFRELRLDNPRAHVRIMEDEQPNFADIVERLEAAAPADPQPEPQAPPRLLIGDLQINGARLVATNLAAVEPEEIAFTPVDFQIFEFTTIPDKSGAYTLGATGHGGGRWEWTGEFGFSPLYSEGNFRLEGEQLRPLWEVARNRVEFEIREGEFAMELDYRVDVRPDSVVARVTDASLRVDGFVLREKGEDPDLLTVDSLTVRGIELAFPEQEAQVGQVVLAGADLSAWLTPEGEINWLALVPEPPVAPADSVTPPPVPWHVVVAEVVLQQCAVHLEDRTLEEVLAVDVAPIDLTLRDFDSNPGTTASIGGQVTIAGEGRLGFDGEVGVDPPVADVRVDLADLPLPVFEPYLAPVARLVVERGGLNVAGRVRFEEGPTPEEPQIWFDGDVAVRNVETKDTIANERFVAWEALEVTGIALAPESIRVEQVVARKPYARVQVHRDRTTNIADVLVPVDSTATAEAAAPAPIPVSIGGVQVVDGSADFSDLSLVIPFATRLSKLNGDVTGLSSDPAARAEVGLTGIAEPNGQAEVTGAINPLAEEVYTDVTVVFRDFDLPLLTPYAGHYIGREIDKGKMELDLHYVLDGRWLKGDNKVILDQLELGDDVESPEATGLPVGLAVALLKDRHGRIDLDIPVEGDVDDPGFSVWDAITDIFWNIITKAVTAPFKLLGALVGFGGDSDELSYATYVPGAATLEPDEAEKLLKLAEALDERPQLRLEVRGSAAPVEDGDALREAAFAKIATERFARDPERYAAPDSVAWAPRLIRDLFEEQFGAEALSMKEDAFRVPELDDEGQPKGDRTVVDEAALVARLEQELVAAQPVEEADLRRLALDRSQEVKRLLVEEGQVLETRVFILDADVEAGFEDGVRVEMNLTS